MDVKKWLSQWGVILALCVSIIVVCVLRCCGWQNATLTQDFVQVCELIGKVFMNGLKMLVVPLIAVSLICGMMGFGSKSETTVPKEVLGYFFNKL